MVQKVPSLLTPSAMVSGVVASSAEGNLAGEAVRQIQSSDASVMGDGKEEASFFHSTEAEKHKTLEERKFEPDEIVVPMDITEIEALLDPTHKFTDPDRLQEILHRLQQSRDPGGTARQESVNPGDRFALLQLALRDARGRGLVAEVTERLQDALDSLAHEFGPRIRAGLNSVWAAREFAATPQGVRKFQKTYADLVLGDQGFSDALSVVLKQLAGVRGADFQRALQALLSALGADLSATHPSVEPVRLQALVQMVYRMEVFVSLLEDCGSLAEMMMARFGITMLDPVELMKALVLIIGERWVLPPRLKALADRFGIKKLRARLAFHGDVANALHDVPEHVYLDLNARQGVLDSARAVIDEAAAEEEEEAS